MPDHKDLGLFVMGESPTHRHAAVLGDQHHAMPFGAAMLQIAPMFDGKAGIAAAVRFERRLMILQADDEGQDCRLVGGQPRFPDLRGANGRAP